MCHASLSLSAFSLSLTLPSFLSLSLCGRLVLQECQIDPGAFRTLDSLIQEQTRGRGTIEILTVKNMEEGDVAL